MASGRSSGQPDVCESAPVGYQRRARAAISAMKLTKGGGATSVLDGVRVLDFGRYVAGPYCAAILAELGADVVRIDDIAQSPDRSIAALAPGLDAGAMFLHVNQNKRSVALDVRAERSRAIIQRLVASSDVVVTNSTRAHVEHLGLDYDAICRYRPDIIKITISAFGNAGSLAALPGFDGVAQALCGAAYLSGSHELGPSKSAATWVDYGTASLAAVSALAAYVTRLKTGSGTEIHRSLLETALTFANPSLIEEAVTKVGRGPGHNRSYFTAPADIYATSDGWVIVQVSGVQMYRRWAEAVGRTDLAEADADLTDSGRAARADEIGHAMSRWCRGRSCADVIERMRAARVPVAEVLSPGRTLSSTEIRSAALLADRDYPNLGASFPVVSTSAGFASRGEEPSRRAPARGEHTREVLLDSGFSTDEITDFIDSGVIYQAS
jgi:crotonobetainyl-CoA:carnitine CoA-transferase CaiB-like acyl-CoA transferase